MPAKYSYTTVGYNIFLRRGQPPLVEIPEDDTAIERPQLPAISISSDIPEKRLQKGLGESIRITGVTTISASVATANGVRVTTTLSDLQSPANIMFGIVETAIYEDNSGQGNSVIPYGSNAIAENYKLHTAYDYHQNVTGSFPGKEISYTIHVENQTGSTHTLHFSIRWRYIGRETGG